MASRRKKAKTPSHTSSGWGHSSGDGGAESPVGELTFSLHDFRETERVRLPLRNALLRHGWKEVPWSDDLTANLNLVRKRFTLPWDSDPDMSKKAVKMQLQPAEEDIDAEESESDEDSDAKDDGSGRRRSSKRKRKSSRRKSSGKSHPQIRALNYFPGVRELDKIRFLWNLRQLSKRADFHGAQRIAPSTFFLFPRPLEENKEADQASSDAAAAASGAADAAAAAAVPAADGDPVPRKKHNKSMSAEERDTFKHWIAAQEANNKTIGKVGRYILKPGSSAKGMGIKIFDNSKDLLQYVDSKCKGPSVRTTEVNESYVVQAYIDNPLLIRGYKFDMRVMAVLTHDRKLYLYTNAVCRLASAKYTNEDLGNLFVHLTNHCIQETNPDLQKDGPASIEVLFPEFGAYIAKEHGKSLEKDVIPAIAQAIKTATQSVSRYMKPYPGIHTYQMLGFDVLLDQNFQAFILEVNTSPGLEPNLADELYEEVYRVVINPMFNGGKIEPPSEAQAKHAGRLQLIHSYR